MHRPMLADKRQIGQGTNTSGAIAGQSSKVRGPVPIHKGAARAGRARAGTV